jgi:hypothetical protein
MYLLNKRHIITVKISKLGFLFNEIHFKLGHATFVIFEIYTNPKTPETFYYVQFLSTLPFIEFQACI